SPCRAGVCVVGVAGQSGSPGKSWRERPELCKRPAQLGEHCQPDAGRISGVRRLLEDEEAQDVGKEVIAVRRITGTAIGRRPRASVATVKRSKFNQATGATSSGLPSGARFHEEIAAAWTAGYARGGFARRLHFFQPILARHVRPGDSWVDLGCGSGVLTKELLALGHLSSRWTVRRACWRMPESR